MMNTIKLTKQGCLLDKKLLTQTQIQEIKKELYVNPINY